MSKQKLGGSTFSYMWQMPVLDSMRLMQAIGLNDFDVITVPGHCWPDDLDQAARRRLRKDMESDGIRVESLNMPGIDQTMASSIASARDYAVSFYQDGLNLAYDLGVRNVVVVPGRVSPLLPPPYEKVVGWVTDSLEKTLAVAEKNDQVLMIEPTPATAFPTIEKMLGVLDHFDASPRIKIAYDVASAEFIGEDIVAAIRMMGDRLGQTHLSDSTRKSWRHDKVGDGTVPFAEVLAALKEANFSGINILEVISTDPATDMRDSIGRLAPHL